MLMLQVSAKSVFDDSEGQINDEFVAIKMSETQLKLILYSLLHGTYMAVIESLTWKLSRNWIELVYIWSTMYMQLFHLGSLEALLGVVAAPKRCVMTPFDDWLTFWVRLLDPIRIRAGVRFVSFPLLPFVQLWDDHFVLFGLVVSIEATSGYLFCNSCT